MAQKKEIRPFYIVMAWSPSRNVLQREFDEEALVHGRQCTDQQLARRRAESFAKRLNESRKLGAQDWQAKIQLTTGMGMYLVRPNQSQD